MRKILNRIIKNGRPDCQSVTDLLVMDGRLKGIEKAVVGYTLEEGLANGEFRGRRKKHLTALVKSVNEMKEEHQDGMDVCPTSS